MTTSAHLPQRDYKKLAALLTRSGQLHRSIDGFLGQLRLDGLVKRPRARPNETPQDVRLLGNDALVRQQPLAQRRNAEIGNRHEVDGLALALLCSHDKIER